MAQDMPPRLIAEHMRRVKDNNICQTWRMITHEALQAR